MTKAQAIQFLMQHLTIKKVNEIYSRFESDEDFDFWAVLDKAAFLVMRAEEERSNHTKQSA